LRNGDAKDGMVSAADGQTLAKLVHADTFVETSALTGEVC
jgi:hypothetical protein